MRTIPILMYHSISRPPDGARLRGLYVRPGAFAYQMALLKWLGYRGLTMTEAMPYLNGGREGRVAVITFDDGYRDNLEAALPVLARHGHHATCYIVSGRVGGYNDWDASSLGVRKPLMDRVQLRRWLDAGMEAGAHSRRHAFLTQLGDAALWDEVAGSKAELEDTLGVSVSQFCYPYGAEDRRVREIAARAGFTAAVTVRRGRARPGDDPFWLPRVKIGGYHWPHVLPLQLLTGYEDGRR